MAENTIRLVMGWVMSVRSGWRFRFAAAVIGAIVAGLAGTAESAFVDLRTRGSSGTINSAFFYQVDPQPTGTGFIDPFVRIQANPASPGGTEQGYNTSYRPVQFDEKTLNGNLTWTHDLLLSDVGKVTYANGKTYYRFLLDINETNGADNALLSLDRLQIFVSPTASLHNYTFPSNNQSKSGTLNGATLVYNMDVTNGGGAITTDNYVLLNYDLNHGSGSGDMFFDVPTSIFPSCTGCYLYLYSKFGEREGSGTGYYAGAGTSDGFEEWAALKSGSVSPPSSVPQPWSLVLVGLGTIGLIARQYRRRTGV